MTIALPAPAARPSFGVSGAGWTALAAAAVLAFLFLFDPRVFGDGDTYWHLAAGEWMLNNGRVPDVDVFSHTRNGAPWVAHEWLSEVVMAAVHRAAGWAGLSVLFAAAAAATAVLMVRRLALSLQGTGLAAAAALGLCMAAESLLARPHVLVLPLLVLWLTELLRARDEDRAPRAGYAVLIALWANLHGSYLLAYLLAGFLGLEALAAAQGAAGRWRVIRTWGGFAALAAGAALLTPHGLDGITHPVRLMGLEATRHIAEWAPADLTEPTPLTAAVAFTLFMALSRGVRVPPVRLSLVLFLLFMALQHTRHAMVLGIAAPLLLAPAFARALGQTPPDTSAGPALGRRAGVLLAALLLAAGGLRLALPIERGEDAVTPAAALAAVPADLARRPVLNEYGFGGYLIFRGVPAYIDGRADMYGDAFFLEYGRAVSDEDALTRALTRHRVMWTIFPARHPAAGMMDRRPGWRRLHADGTAVVHVREDAAPPR